MFGKYKFDRCWWATKLKKTFGGLSVCSEWNNLRGWKPWTVTQRRERNRLSLKGPGLCAWRHLLLPRGVVDREHLVIHWANDTDIERIWGVDHQGRNIGREDMPPNIPAVCSRAPVVAQKAQKLGKNQPGHCELEKKWRYTVWISVSHSGDILEASWRNRERPGRPEEEGEACLRQNFKQALKWPS